MKIYTSYFGNIKNITNPVSISVFPPRWYLGPCYKKLAPSWNLVKNFKAKSMEDIGLAIEMYTHIYTRERLNKLEQSVVFKELSEIYNDDDVVLLCYEAPEKFCHRHLVAKWFQSVGIDVKEL
jgi:uncharacterized protein YeaO (DUF488 family)